jgi:pilus assembly protein Flp/PilA
MRKLRTLMTVNVLGHFLRDESGSTAIEYALVASGVSIVIVGTVTTVGNSVKDFYSAVANALK